MKRIELLEMLKSETDSFNIQSRLRDDVLDAMEQAYLKGKNKQCNIANVVGQSEQLVCSNCDGYGYTVDENGRRKEHCTKCE